MYTYKYIQMYNNKVGQNKCQMYENLSKICS